jgi:pimeloyl-ACP methyl ester carboxylesterase
VPEMPGTRMRLHYEVSGAGIPLVFLHGMGGSIRQVTKVYRPLDGVLLVVPDQQGHGQSDADWSTYSFDTLADDVIRLADHLGIQKFFLAGISMGAAVSANIAIRYGERVRGMLLIRNAWTDKPMGHKVQKLFSACAESLKANSLAAFKATPEYAAISGGSEYTRQAFTGMFDDEASVRHYQKFMILPQTSPFCDTALLARIRQPVTVLANRNDLVHPFEYGKYYQRNIPGAAFYEIADKDTDVAAHNAAINRHLEETLGYRG